MNKRFHIVAKAKLKKKAQAEREAKKGKRPKLPWKKASDSAGQSLGAITEMSFKDYLTEARYYKAPDDWQEDIDEHGSSIGVCPKCRGEARYETDHHPRGGMYSHWVCQNEQCGYEQR
jgi:hypothetical protein